MFILYVCIYMCMCVCGSKIQRCVSVWPSCCQSELNPADPSLVTHTNCVCVCVHQAGSNKSVWQLNIKDASSWEIMFLPTGRSGFYRLGDQGFTDFQARLEKLQIATLISLRKFTHNRHIFFCLAKEVRGQTAGHMSETGTSGNNNIWLYSWKP